MEILYVRVSTVTQSFFLQKHKLLEYIKNNKVKKYMLLEDFAKSGKDLNRSGIRKIIDCVQAGEVKKVVCYSRDRLSRKTTQLVYLLSLFSKNGVVFESLTDESSNLFYPEAEHKKMVERTTEVLRLKKAARKVYGTIPYGYKREGEDLVINKKEQAVIVFVKYARKKGYKFKDILNEVTEQGYRTRAGKVFNLSSIQKINKMKVVK